MPLFRSKTMYFCQIIIPRDTIFETLTKLGELKLVQFVNVNEHVNALSLPYVSEIYELKEVEQSIDFMFKECEAMGIHVPQPHTSLKAPTIKKIHEITSEIEKFQNSIEVISRNAQLLEKVSCTLRETKFVLEFCEEFFVSAGISFTRQSLYQSLIHSSSIDFHLCDDDHRSHETSPLEFLSGTIPIARKPAFERMLWRVCKSNFYAKFSKNTVTSFDTCGFKNDKSTKVEKMGFLIFFYGTELKKKIMKICEGFHCKLTHCPETTDDRTDLYKDVVLRLNDMNVIINRTEREKIDILKLVSEKLFSSLIMVKNMKAIYFTMNQLSIDKGDNFFVGKLILVFFFQKI